MNTLEIIEECSGICGITMYKSLSPFEFIEWFKNDIQYNTKESKKLGEQLIAELETDIHIQEQAYQKMIQAEIEAWCLTHNVSPKLVTYENGKICIPLLFE